MHIPLNVLILCTGNSARSILAEGLIRQGGGARFTGHSAGSQPKDQPHPLALELLAAEGIDTGFARSKSWDEFAAPGAPAIDVVITVCDSAAAETCPVWPGSPVSVHWGVPDPASAEGSLEDRRAAFADARARLGRRVDAMLALPVEDLDAATLKTRLTEIGTL